MLSAGETIKHKKFGEGVIVELVGDILSPDMRVVIKFNTFEEIKSFKLGVLNQFFELDSDITAFIENLNKEQEVIRKKEVAKVATEIESKKAKTKPKKYLEFCENIPIDEWKKLIYKANDFRFVYQDKAVVIDGNIIYPSTKIALIDMGKDVQLSELVYGVCEMNKGKGSEFDGHKYRYATATEIESIVERLENVNS